MLSTHHLQVILPFIPISEPKLSPVAYELVLNSFLQTDCQVSGCVGGCVVVSRCGDVCVGVSRCGCVCVGVSGCGCVCVGMSGCGSVYL